MSRGHRKRDDIKISKKQVNTHSISMSNSLLLKMCERSELVNISQFFCSFSQTRHLTEELSQTKPKLDWKTSKMTRQFRLQNRSKNNYILGKV